MTVKYTHLHQVVMKASDPESVLFQIRVKCKNLSAV